MPVPLSDVTHAEIVMHGNIVQTTAQTKPWANVFHFRRTSTVNDLVRAHVASAFDTAICQVYLDAAADVITGTKISVRWLNDPYDAASEYNANPNTAGQVGTDPLPNQNCVSMLLRTGWRGRSFKGGKRFAGVPEAHTTEDLLTGGGLTLWEALRDAITTGFTDSDGNVWVPYVVSRILSNLTSDPATIVGADVAETLLNKTIGSMDRRRPKTVR